VAHNPEQLADAILKLRNQFGSEQPILVEEFLSGSDLTVGIIGNKHNYNVLPIIEEDYSDLPEGLPRICGYEAKWLFDSEYMKTLKSVKANLPQNTEQEIINFSIKLMERLNCRDYCRFDWRLNAQGEPKLLEVNPNPGWCWDGHLAKMANLAGMDYAQMLQSIICAAEARFSVNSNV
jgi:D-alanine-D-alanine ligase